MRGLLRILALTVIAASLIAWLSLGANLGWTKTSITRWQFDPVTENYGPIIEKRFVPGVDLLALCIISAVALFSLSLLKPKTPASDAEPRHNPS